MSDDKDLVADKLDILIKLQAASFIEKFESQKDKILFLGNAGLETAQIADIVGTTRNTVSVTLSNHRKKEKKVGKKD